MTQEERLDYLLAYLLDEHEEYRAITVPDDTPGKRRLLRSLMNVRLPQPVNAEFLDVQDAYLQGRLAERGVTRADDLPFAVPGVHLWQGDITTLAVDAIVNAASSQLLGCFIPCHGCIDNAIHTYAGVQLRLACARIMQAQGASEPTGRAQITSGYNLPAAHVLHTVGPIVQGALTQKECDLLASCYASCLDLAVEHHVRSVAFCCISTGEFGFPNEPAARIAISTVSGWQCRHPNVIDVTFNVFKDEDLAIYRELLGGEQPW